MKKFIFVSLLLLLMASSIVAGSLAMYTTSIDGIASGSVLAKEFIFLEDGTDSFQQGVKIAPAETVRWQFGVKNFDGQVITETDLYYKLAFHVSASAGKTAIEPLTVTVKDSSGNTLSSVTGTGEMIVTGAFPLSTAGQEQFYIVEIYWPSDDSVDIGYAGDSFGTTVGIDAVASQIPFEGQGTTPTPTPTPTPSGDDYSSLPVRLNYHIINAWWTDASATTNRANYTMTLTNLSDRKIYDWYVIFDTPNEFYNAYSSIQTSVPGGYRLTNPVVNNAWDARSNIDANSNSITFGGQMLSSSLRNLRTPAGNIRVGGKIKTESGDYVDFVSSNITLTSNCSTATPPKW